MARPTPGEMASEERLSLAHGELSGIIERAGVVSALHRQIYRREPRLKEYLDRAREELEKIVDLCDAAQRRIAEELGEGQERRREKNRG